MIPSCKTMEQLSKPGGQVDTMLLISPPTLFNFTFFYPLIFSSIMFKSFSALKIFDSFDVLNSLPLSWSLKAKKFNFLETAQYSNILFNS